MRLSDSFKCLYITKVLATPVAVDAGREVGMAQFKCKASSNLEARFPESLYDPVVLDSEDAPLQIFSLDEFRWD